MSSNEKFIEWEKWLMRIQSIFGERTIPVYPADRERLLNFTEKLAALSVDLPEEKKREFFNKNILTDLRKAANSEKAEERWKYLERAITGVATFVKALKAKNEENKTR